MTDEWIWVCRWQDFQHYKPHRDRGPAWIKSYCKQLDDDRYLQLTDRQRALLADLRHMFATSRARLRHDARTIAARRRSQTRHDDLVALNHAGFIEVCSRAVLDHRLELLYSTSSRPRAREEEELEEEKDLYPGVGLDNGHKQQPPDFNIPNLKPIPDESEAW